MNPLYFSLYLLGTLVAGYALGWVAAEIYSRCKR